MYNLRQRATSRGNMRQRELASPLSLADGTDPTRAFRDRELAIVDTSCAAAAGAPRHPGNTDGRERATDDGLRRRDETAVGRRRPMRWGEEFQESDDSDQQRYCQEPGHGH